MLSSNHGDLKHSIDLHRCNLVALPLYFLENHFLFKMVVDELSQDLLQNSSVLGSVRDHFLLLADSVVLNGAVDVEQGGQEHGVGRLGGKDWVVVGKD